MLRITALQDVQLYANVVSYEVEDRGEGQIYKRPINTKTFIFMQKGERRSDISLFFGIDPSFLPGEDTFQPGLDVQVVPYRPGKNSDAFHALVEVDRI